MKKSLSDYVHVKGRFHRSVHLARDFADGQSHDGYILTPTASELALRMLEATRDAKAPRAWSITGPYGTGKSSFALFLTDLLSGNATRSSTAGHFRRNQKIRIRPFLCAPIMGQRGPIGKTILEGLHTAAKQWEVRPKIVKKIQTALRATNTNDQDIISIFDELSNTAREKKHGGILVVIDEFGKFLEYAALHPEDEDIHLMQGLAESAARSKIPFLLITILHTAFDSYLQTSDHVRQAEWAKVQGRFQDVIFLEPANQMLTLIGESIEQNFPPDLSQKYCRAAKKVLKSKVINEVRERVEIEDLALSCLPLHPIVTTLLWPVFRSQLSQNERSLFSFLTSNEPHGFQDFLLKASSDGKPQFYTADRLFDYISSSLGPALFHGTYARRWAEITESIDRIRSDAPSLTSKVLKTAGLLMLHGTAMGLRANKETLIEALDNRRAVLEAIDYLTEKSILVFRRHANAYGLWEGSDVNVDECYQVGLTKIEGLDYSSLIKGALDLNPVVARAHYFETGTFRTFVVDVIDGREDKLIEYLNNDVGVRDGRILFVLTNSARSRKKLVELTRELSAGFDSAEVRPTICAFPKPISGLENRLKEVEVWKWVVQNTPALDGDRPARKEVLTRLAFANEKLISITGETFGLRGQPFKPKLSTWIYLGDELSFSSSQEFLKWLSHLCDDVFSESPTIKNELINRDHLSSAAAAARNNLLKAMLRSPNEYRLGIEGTPPEVSMYESLLHESGFHRVRKGQIEFGGPSDDWRPVWIAFQEFLKTTRKTRRPVVELYDLLKRPPYGLREGPLPILVALVLLVFPDRVALYSKEGVFIPELRDEVFELFVRNPGDFEIQQFASDKTKKRILAETAKVLARAGVETDGEVNVLLDVVKPLVVFAAKLPQFTKNTKKLDNKTITFREALLKAKDPQLLLFEEIPDALGLKQGKKISARGLAKELEKAIHELNRAYPNLLDEIEQGIRSTLSLKGRASQVKEILKLRSEAIVPFAVEQTLSLFAREATRIKDRDWREVLGRVIQKGIPPERWTDNDAVEFQMRLQLMRGDFLRLEELIAEKGKLPDGQIVRVGLLDGKYEEAREIVLVTPDMEPVIYDLQKRIIESLESEELPTEDVKGVRIAALARIIAKEIEKGH